MAATIKWLPSIPCPVPFDIQKRTQQLRSYLDPNDPSYQPKQQHKNIKAAIKLYEDGKIDGVEQVFIKDGKLVPKQEIFKGGAWCWNEGIGHQYANKHAYGHGPFGANFHEIRMLLRLTPGLGGDGTVCGIIPMNDTGSDMLTLFTTDLQHLGHIQGYAGWLAPMGIRDANGSITFLPTILVQVQLVRDDNSPWGDWIDEWAVVRQPDPNVPRLSGVGIRGLLFIASLLERHSLAMLLVPCTAPNLRSQAEKAE